MLLVDQFPAVGVVPAQLKSPVAPGLPSVALGTLLVVREVESFNRSAPHEPQHGEPGSATTWENVHHGLLLVRIKQMPPPRNGSFAPSCPLGEAERHRCTTRRLFNVVVLLLLLLVVVVMLPRIPLGKLPWRGDRKEDHGLLLVVRKKQIAPPAMDLHPLVEANFGTGAPLRLPTGGADYAGAGGSGGGGGAAAASGGAGADTPREVAVGRRQEGGPRPAACERIKQIVSPEVHPLALGEADLAQVHHCTCLQVDLMVVLLVWFCC